MTRVCCILDLISDVYFGSDGSRGKESPAVAEVAGDAIPAAALAQKLVRAHRLRCFGGPNDPGLGLEGAARDREPF